MKRRVLLVCTAAVVVAMLMTVTACGGSSAAAAPDYSNAADFEAALNKGDDLTGKTVQFEVTEVVPDSAFGYNLQAGEHLNFCSTDNPNVKAGETITVEVTEVQSLLGSWIISYKKK